MSAEALETMAKQLGHQIRVETQGSVGAQNALTADEIAAAPSRKDFSLGVFGVHPESAPFVLDIIRQRFGSDEAYLEAEYGLTPARLMRLRRMYLE